MASSPSKRPISFVTLDVFTKERFTGNPLAIVKIPLGSDLSQQDKQRIAREFNLSETVFLHPPPSEGEASSRRCDIFTTTEELPFAGHPTIGTLAYLYQHETTVQSPRQTITLQTKAGPIGGRFRSFNQTAEASIPHNVRIHRTPVPMKSIVHAQPSLKGSEARLKASYPLVSIVKGMTFVLINLAGVGDLAELVVGGPRIDPSTVEWDQGWASFTAPYFYTILSESKEARRIRIRSRMIEPSFGEDPATGSAASALAAYLALQRGMAGATYSFAMEQGVEMGRNSDIGVDVTLDDSGRAIDSVALSGSAVLVSQGTLTV
ncbi:MAG: hypothetical protein LQ338_004260 [Usnochroma carphineum]|nr:MAG: hypothetical protein LQ338_004260 [Usnochroma carphineum]